MKNKTSSLLKHLTLAVLLAATASAVHAADASGTWTWSTLGRNGGPDRTTTLTLKADGEKLTGKVSSPGRDGATTDTPIANGKVEGDKISFIVVREFNGRSSTNSYSGTVADDKITGKSETVRNGEPQSHDWSAKRTADSK
jgi:uncharacterized protein (DUF2147 family)